jgi:N-methylhydantoinase A
LKEAFAAAHVRHFGYRSDEEAVEIVNVRVIARASTGETLHGRLSLSAEKQSDRARDVYFGPEAGFVSTPVVSRADLGQWEAGPLLVEEFDSTTVVPPDGRARRIAWDTIEIELG